MIPASRWCAIALLLAGAAAAAPDEAAKLARSKFEEGMIRYNLGRYKEALAAFEAGYMSRPDPVFLYNIGQCSRMLGDPEGAARSYRAYLREKPAAPNRAEVENFIALAEKEIQRRAANVPPTHVEPVKSESPPTKSEPAATKSEPAATKSEPAAAKSEPVIKSEPVAVKTAAVTPPTTPPAEPKPNKKGSRAGVIAGVTVVVVVVAGGAALGLGLGLGLPRGTPDAMVAGTNSGNFTASF